MIFFFFCLAVWSDIEILDIEIFRTRRVKYQI